MGTCSLKGNITQLVDMTLWCQPYSQEWSVCFLFVHPSMDAWCVICMHEILIFAGCRTGERRASGGGMPPCADFPYRLYHQDSVLLGAVFRPLRNTRICYPGGWSVSTCFILLDVHRGIAAVLIPVLFCVGSFDERLTCRVWLHDYERLRATWFVENLGLYYVIVNIRCLVSHNLVINCLRRSWNIALTTKKNEWLSARLNSSLIDYVLDVSNVNVSAARHCIFVM
jgi:hypothetical protein